MDRIPQLPQIAQLIQSLIGPPTQHQRLLKLHTVLGPDVLLAERVDIEEGIGPGPGPDANADADAVPDTRVDLPTAGTRASDLFDISNERATAVTDRPPSITCLTAASRNSGVYRRSGPDFIRPPQGQNNRPCGVHFSGTSSNRLALPRPQNSNRR